ncbi:MAG: TlpA family protein disulfide reductase [Deltaproteobacteria bacterium]|nr:TlpA family protein disulfide reductase [Deltaproteobacteria bacterium]
MKPDERNLLPSPDVTEARAAAQSDWTSRVLLVVATALLAVTFAREFFASTPDIVGKPAPPLTARRLDGTPISLTALTGKVVLMDFWSVACGPCVSQIPILSAVESRYRGRAFQLVSLNVEPTEWPTAGNWLKQRLAGSIVVTTDSRTASAYGAARLPHLVLVGTDGVVAQTFSGFTREATLAAAIDREMLR